MHYFDLTPFNADLTFSRESDSYGKRESSSLFAGPVLNLDEMKPATRKPLFITLEGPEGTGKSTLARTLAEALTKRFAALGLKQKIVHTREPGGSKVAEQIRALILENPMDPWTELFLYEAARAEHLAQTIRPTLAEGAWVICDRYTDSTLAYQGAARGLDWATVRRLNTIATQGLKPDLTLLLDADPAKSLKFVRDPNRFEAEGLAFHQKVRKGFLKIAREEPRRFLVMKARCASPEVMAEKVVTHLSKKIKLLKNKK